MNGFNFRATVVLSVLSSGCPPAEKIKFVCQLAQLTDIDLSYNFLVGDILTCLKQIQRWLTVCSLIYTTRANTGRYVFFCLTYGIIVEGLLNFEGTHFYGQIPPDTQKHLKDVLQEGMVFIIKKFMCNPS
ncbi:hypothetical protein ACQ4PT_035263 [Festuca glaucescens]